MWQLQDFGRGPHYTNVQYPFFVDPPHPPYTDNECGSYITHFSVPETLKDHQLRLRFEGVDSGFHVWLNGKEVGYSELNHLLRRDIPLIKSHDRPGCQKPFRV